jgi:tetratricopeptide (TPR) repeat protein
MSDRVANAFLSYVRYLVQAAWPRDLAVFYPYPEAFSLWPVVGAALLLFAILALIWRAGRARPWLMFGWIWYIVSLLPVIGLVQIGSHARADRYTYVPLVGVFVMVVWGAHDLTRRWRHRAAALTTAASAVILVCTLFTRRQISLWRDTETLLRHAIAVTQDNTMAYNNLGAALAGEARLDEAIGLLREAAKLNPEDAGVQDNLGAALARQGRLDEAIVHLRAAVRLNPAHAGAHNDLGAALGRAGRLDEAREQLQIAVTLAPGDAGAHCNLGDALASTGLLDDAVGHYQVAIKLNPDYAEAHCNLGLTMGRQGRLDEAIVHLQEALTLRPDYTDAQNNLRAVLNLKAAAGTVPGRAAKP